MKQGKYSKQIISEMNNLGLTYNYMAFLMGTTPRKVKKRVENCRSTSELNRFLNCIEGAVFQVRSKKYL